MPIPLYLMAKAPVPGKVKTRMQPQLDPVQSARLAKMMLAQTMETVCRFWPGKVILCVWPDPEYPVFTRLAGKYQVKISSQINADLGARMMHLLKEGIEHGGCSAVMGCDVPHCPGGILADAHTMLARGGNPVGPAEDGGFYLIGLQQADDSLFNGIKWGGSGILDAVRGHAALAGVHLTALPPLRDIDRYPDLEWLARIDDRYKRFIE